MQTILNFFSDSFSDAEYYCDYEQFCADNDMQPQGQNSDDYFQYLNDCRRNDMEFVLDSIQQIAGPVLVSGSLGLWTGKHPIVPRQFNNISKALFAVLDNAEDYCISYDRGILTIETIHHDGRNIFHIRKSNGQFIKLPQY